MNWSAKVNKDKGSSNEYLKNILTLRFLIVLSASIALMFTLFILFFRKPILLKFTASIAAFALNLVGVQAKAHGILVGMPKLNMIMVYECTGIYAMIVYASCVLAYPSGMKDKGIGLLLGISGIYLLNILRFMVLGLVGNVSLTLFALFHRYLWEVSFMFLVFMLWVLWIDKVAESGK